MNPFIAGLIGFVIALILMLLYRWLIGINALIVTDPTKTCCTAADVRVAGKLKPDENEEAVGIKAKVFSDTGVEPDSDVDAMPGTLGTPDADGERTYEILINRMGLNEGKVKIWAEFKRIETAIHSFNCEGNDCPPTTPTNPTPTQPVQP